MKLTLRMIQRSMAKRALSKMAPLMCRLPHRFRGVSFERGAERFLQWLQPLFVVPPMFDCLGEDRHTDLFGTRGAHDAVILIKPEAIFFEGKAAGVQQPAHV